MEEECTREKGRFVGVSDCFGDGVAGVGDGMSTLDFGVVGCGGVEG